ncbi:MAG: PDDEXK nuclease domain-containing protein [Muribaculaceae bacterium]|nr:PDDEXK nuclease domain-containing protein [Muribaculaceae bacterium]
MANKEDNKPAFVKRDSIVTGKEYSQLLGALKDRFRKSQIKAAVKVNTTMLEFYWEMGRDVARLYENAKYGSAFFDCLSLDLKTEFPGQTGFSAANIRYAYRWYTFYNQANTNLQRVVEDFNEDKNSNLHQVGEDFEMPADFGLIPWGQHIDIFTKSKSVEEALFYIEETIKNSWSRPELNAEIDDDLYGKHGKAITNFDDKLPAPYSGLAKDILKSPYDFGFIDKKIVNEKQFEDELASNITRFLLELGQGFAYVGRQMELKMPGGQTFIPDMVFYHTRLKLYIVVELKVTPFIPEYAGKLNFYVSAVDELLKQDDDNPTIGLLICKSKDNTVVEWSFRGMNQPLGVAEYKLGMTKKANEMLPSESELQRIIDTYDERIEE